MTNTNNYFRRTRCESKSLSILAGFVEGEVILNERNTAAGTFA